MQRKAASIMVSSTFYDLRQIRADLAKFIIDDLGYVPLLSEMNSFPIDPNSDTVENCKKRVENEADILVLIIGGRYGYIDSKSAKSITNLEYLTAHLKGIPIFAFVQKDVLALLPIWKSNKTADFSATVDDPRVFNFIEKVRSIDKIWMFEFETAQNIIETLRIQFAYLMFDGLSLKLRLKDNVIPKDPNLSGESIRIYLEKPEAWEYRLFAHSLIDQIKSLDDRKREYELGLTLGVSEKVTVSNLSDWCGTRVNELLLISNTLTKIAPDAMSHAFGPPGKPGDADEIIFVTRKLSAIYLEAIEWFQRVNRASFDNKLKNLQNMMSAFSKTFIDQISNLAPRIIKEVDEYYSLPEPRSARSLTISLSIEIPNMDKFISVYQAALKNI
ncbi:MAG: DUF4062 domain-containing protein [Bacteroidota bacterium]|jgi:hypothetical protein